MMPNRWDLADLGKKTLAVAAGFFLASELLARAEHTAQQEAEMAVRRHEWDEHGTDPMGGDDE